MLELIENRVEPFTKGLALTAAVVYLCGYLVVSARYASYGFTTDAIIKPKIIEAGTTFLLLFLLPSCLAQKALPQEEIVSSSGLAKHGLGLMAFWGEILTLSPLRGLLVRNDWIASQFKPRWYESSASIFIIICGVIVFYYRKNKEDRIREHPWRVATVTWFTFIAIVGERAWHATQSDAAAEVWFLLAGLFGCWTFRRVRSGMFSLQNLAFAIALFLIAVSYYADMLYPHLDQRWGGGHSVPIAFSVLDKSTNKLGELINANLLDQEDTGIYVQFGSSDAAVFIPKELVAELCFLEGAQPHGVMDFLGSRTPRSVKATDLVGCHP